MALGLTCALGAALRFWDLDYSLPGVYHPDEIPILSRALAFAKGDPSPHNFLYPSLYFYMLFAWEVLFLGVGWLAGWFSSVADFQAQYFRDASPLVLAARALTATCGAITLVAVFALGRRLFDATVGVVAALFLAVSPFAVRDAHYVKLDVPVTMFTAFALAALARVVVDASAARVRRPWMTAGFLAGLAMSTQYYVIFLAVAIAAAAVAQAVRLGQLREPAVLLGWAALATSAGFVAGTPFFFPELGTALRDIAGVREVDIDRALAAGGGAFTSLPDYLYMLGVDAMGWPVAVGACVGLAWLAAVRSRALLVLALFPAAYLAFLAHTVPMSRYVNCVLPSMAVLAAYAVVQGSRRLQPRTAGGALLLGAALVSIPGLKASVRALEFYGQADTRTLAREFIDREIPPGSSILIQPYSAPIHRSRASLVEALRANLGSETRASVKFQLEMAITPPLQPAYRTIYYGDGGMDADKIYVLPQEFDDAAGVEPLRRRGIQYVVLKRGSTPNPETQRLEAALRREGRLLATFSPYRGGIASASRAHVQPFSHNASIRIDPVLERPGPIVDVWQLN